MIFLKLSIILVYLSLFSFTTESQLYSICPNTTTFTRNSTYQSNRNLLLFSLITNGFTNGFYNATAGRNTIDPAYGLFLCRGDVDASTCQNCVTSAIVDITQRCPNETDATIWYDDCLLRYSNRSFFSTVDTSPAYFIWNTQNISEPERFNALLGTILNEAATQASNASKRFATKRVDFNGSQSLYSLVQCTPDLTNLDCNRCLRQAIAALQTYSYGKQGGRVLGRSCNILYEIISKDFMPFPQPPPAPAPEQEQRQKGGLRTWIIVVITVLASLGAVLLCQVGVTKMSFAWHMWRKHEADKEKKEITDKIKLIGMGESPIGDDYSNENLREKEVKSQEFPQVQLGLILKATQDFSDENKLGEGGFGSVYKGTLVDGKEIVVKRLSRTSGQRLQEFNNEIVLIAKLQHKNLVRLLGCCSEGNELLLIYEYMPNKSLDVLLFDSTRGAQLDWKIRLSIIRGIARGLLYLHEDSRLKIIHRDLKASNILLDHEMNPKISNFGMTRIFVGNQTEANTNKVARTKYGYMAPEYAMEGLFSVKSDVFSFGVLLLEIVCGKKNNCIHLSEHGQSLLNFAWKLWCKGKALELIDPVILQSFVEAEVLKCIHVGLLCVQEDPADRPTMSFVVAMLESETLIQPKQPAFSVGLDVTNRAESSSNIKV